MVDPFDVFNLDNGDQPMWEASAPTIDDAQRLVQQSIAIRPTNYLILCQKTGQQTVIKPRILQNA
jgi:hypothetical protein